MRLDIKQRQAEGIALAKAQGKHLGRPQIEIRQEFKDVNKEGKITARNAMKKSNIPFTTFYRLIKRYESGK